MQTDTLVHLAGWLLTVLGAIHTAYPVLPGAPRSGAAALVAAAVGAYEALGPGLVGPLSVAIAAYSLVAGTLVEPLPITGRRQALLVAGLPLTFLLLSLGTRLAPGAGATGHLIASLVADSLVALAVSVSLAVPTFVLSRQPPPTDREASIGRFLAGTAIGRAVAIGPAAPNTLLIGGDRNLAYLALGIANLVVALNGEPRLLLHTPQARFAVSGSRTRPVKGIAIRRFRRGARVGAVLSLGPTRRRTGECRTPRPLRSGRSTSRCRSW